MRSRNPVSVLRAACGNAPFDAVAVYEPGTGRYDINPASDRAIKAGCTAVMPPADMFWGDRYGQLKDPFGVIWAMNGPVKK